VQNSGIKFNFNHNRRFDDMFDKICQNAILFFWDQNKIKQLYSVLKKYYKI